MSATWIRASRRIYTWAVKRRKLTSNPFSDVTIEVPRRKKLRPKSFHAHETRTILTSAAAVIDCDNPNHAARRWAPWLLAYTGARPGEITQLQGSNVEHIEGIWALNLTPEAGTIKGSIARRVPLHEHLIEQGFLEFVQGKGNGPLFYRRRKEAQPDDLLKRKKSPAAQARQRLAAWVREIGVTDEHLSPNHAWRHTFKLLGSRADISEKLLDYVCGHTPATEGRGYGEPSLGDMAEALKKFPRYQLEPSASDPEDTKGQQSPPADRER